MTKSEQLDRVAEGCVVPCDGVESRNCHAWDNVMPPPPNSFHVTGEVYVPNPGVVPILTPRVPQGISPAILLLDLILIQKPGAWPRVLTWKTARYELTYRDGTSGYKSVNVFCGEEMIADIDVQIVE